MRIAFIAKPGHSRTGVGRYSITLVNSLRETGFDVERVAPAVLPLPNSGYSALRRLGVDLRSFLTNYPVWAKYPEADLFHLSSQNLASLLLFRRPPGRIVATVHDIIPYMLRDDPLLCSYHTAADRFFDRMAMKGLRRADRLIAVSEYTRQCLVRHLKIAAEKIEVIHEAVDHRRFRPVAVPGTILEKYELLEDRRYLIYVGSEDPRKNLTALVRALAELRCDLPDVELIKVGQAHFEQERLRLVELAKQFGVLSAIHFLDEVPEDDLPLLYNAADVAITPSVYEGFGFPVLEAMACGTPVVCADAGSLPEIAGGAGMLVRCAFGHMSGLAPVIRQILTDHLLREELRTKGLARASTFRWSDTASRVARIYLSFDSNAMNSGGQDIASSARPELQGASHRHNEER